MPTVDTMTETPAGEPYLATHDPGRRTTVLADDRRTRGALGVVVRDLRRGDDVAWLRHPGQDLAYLVLDGDVEFRVDDRRWTARPVSLLLSPRGAAHCYRALTDARVALLLAPAGAEHVLEHAGPPSDVDAALLLPLAQEHRLDVIPDFLPVPHDTDLRKDLP